MKRYAVMLVVIAAMLAESRPAPAQDLTQSTIVLPGKSSRHVRTAAQVLQEEVQKRSGVTWPIRNQAPKGGSPIFVYSSRQEFRESQHGGTMRKPDAYQVRTVEEDGTTTTHIIGADARGVLFGVGHFLRNINGSPGKVTLVQSLNVTSVPAYPLRGHQLGYRARANSWDAWTVEQFDQYIRELALFGTNAIENIPFEDDMPSLHMKMSRDEMNIAMSAICDKYGLEHWIWMPAVFDLNDLSKREALLQQNEDFFRRAPRLDAVFFPGGDPGNNHPERVMPFLHDLSKRLQQHHAKAKVWLSLQGFDDEQVDYFYDWIEEHMPAWFGGVVCGPSSPPIPETRSRLPRHYPIRHYPDITHTVRSQYPTPFLDPAFAYTLGREPVNPEPVRYSFVHNVFAPYTCGFLTYSDGVHDDVNKVIFSALGEDPQRSVREILIEYARFFFGAQVAEEAADGILALERNWHGALALNSGVDATLALWQGLEKKAPELAGNWRWQMCLMRAYYDAYTRHRLLYEDNLELRALNALVDSLDASPGDAARKALDILREAESKPVRSDLRDRAVHLCDDLFRSIGLQTSVPKHNASGAERGAVLDYIDYPLNDRRWLEDEIDKALKLGSNDAIRARFRELRAWEHPGSGSFYDEVGNPWKSPRVVRGEQFNTDPNNDRVYNTDFMWINEGNHRLKQAWVSKYDWPPAMRYEGLDPKANYVIRAVGYKDCFVRVDGERLLPTVYDTSMGGIKEFPVPSRFLRDQTLVLTFDVPFEAHLNWREHSRIGEIWLLKQ